MRVTLYLLFSFVLSSTFALGAEEKDNYFSVFLEGFQEAEKPFNSSGQKVFYEGKGLNASYGKVLSRYKGYFLLGEGFLSYTRERGDEAIDKETKSHSEIGIKLRGGISKAPTMKLVTGVSAMYFNRASARFDMGLYYGLELSFNQKWFKDFWAILAGRDKKVNNDRDVSSPPYEIILDFTGSLHAFEARRAGTTYHFGVRYYY